VVLVNAVPAIAAPLQTTMFAGTVTLGVGFTVMVYVEEIPTQALTVGVTEIVAVMGAVEVLVAVNPVISPVPFAAKPIAVLELVQTNVPPAGVLINAVVAIAPLLQTTIFAGTVTVGVGLIVMVFVAIADVHPPAAAMLLVTV